MRLIDLAWRNILRNRRRTWLTLTGAWVGVAVTLCVVALFDGNGVQMIRNQTGIFTGHLQIHRHGYDLDPGIDATFSPERLTGLQIDRMPGVVAVAPRLSGRALLSSDTLSRGVMLTGIEPSREAAVTTLHQYVAAGRPLSSAERGGILIGQPLAQALQVGVGDTVSVVTQGVRGAFGAERYRVSGIFDTRNEGADSAQVFITLPDADELFVAQGEWSTLAMRLDRHEGSVPLAAVLSARLGGDYEVLHWKALLPSVVQFITFHNGMANMFLFVIFSVVALGIGNTVLMSVMERRRELGVMMAIGTPPRQVFLTVVCEGLLLGLMGLVGGVLLASAPIAYFSEMGISLGTSALQNVQTQGLQNSGIGYPSLAAGRLAEVSLLVIFTVLVASAYPAFKTARLVPLQAMRGLASFTVKPPRRGAGPHRFPAFNLALRNLGRQPLRTGVGIGIVAFGMAALVVLAGVGGGYTAQVVENATGLVTGDAQVQHKDFRADKDLRFALPDGARLLEAMKRVPGVAAASPRLEVAASASTALQAQPVVLVGVDAEQETRVTSLALAITQGRYLASGGDRELVLGKKLAGLLGVAVGDKVVVSVRGRTGVLAQEALHVVGIFDTGSHGADRALAHVALSRAQEMAGIGSSLTGIALKVENRDSLEAMLPLFQAALSDPRQQVLPWYTLLPDMAQVSHVLQRISYGVLLLVTGMIAVIVMNTILMSVLERTREFGILLALGNPPAGIVRLVSQESALLGAAGVLLGLAVGGGLVLAHVKKGFNLASHGAAAVPGVSTLIHPRPDGVFWLQAAGLMLALVVLAGGYPAFRASRLQAARAIHHA